MEHTLKEDILRVEHTLKKDIVRVEHTLTQVEHALKEDIVRVEHTLKADIARLEHETKQEFIRLEATFNGKFNLLNWMMGFILVGVVSVLFKLFFHA